MVRVTRDVPPFGLASGRIIALATSGSDATSITVDEVCVMEAAKSYGARIRLANGTHVAAVINTVAGEQTTLTFTTPVAPPIPAGGDLFG